MIDCWNYSNAEHVEDGMADVSGSFESIAWRNARKWGMRKTGNAKGLWALAYGVYLVVILT